MEHDDRSMEAHENAQQKYVDPEIRVSYMPFDKSTLCSHHLAQIRVVSRKAFEHMSRHLEFIDMLERTEIKPA